ncbi:MmcQ/YjbR family DNA-binding protein [Telmatocola sphagniphila]|uniref:MmcQ/YjbR family DNA-binding protein n=1 Tax=Telmatocola sphagniphila TaxID=1123043 RepID=A0A8E6B3I8_9BACT|nr:MmcQ/YjbR family DNA-binding protein [Telmatocola sphagniphila]QVL31066.1 MmcQ/YjbR family DNA-binding protein [Telmatocola sphagniphila]
MARSRKKSNSILTWSDVQELVTGLPEIEEGTSYGTPAFKVKGKLFVRLHQDLDCLVVKIDPEEREMQMTAQPGIFFITDHYRDYPWMLVKLAGVHREDLKDLLIEAWRLTAPNKLVAKFDESAGN